MSNETDLDWLARNVHVWPTNTPKAILPGDATFKLGAVFYGDCVAFSGELGPEFRMVNKADWLTRRAELQNKPRFADHPDAKCFVQNPCGYWWKNTETSNVIPFGDYWRVSDSVTLNCVATAWVEILGKGEVLGDWRDTLEKRPEKTIVDICGEVTQENRHEEIFEPFASIEDSQEKEVKQDNGWFERGELPPVGVWCDALSEPDMEWLAVEVIAHRDGFAIVWCRSEKSSANCDDPKHFRPIGAERDVLIEIIKETDDTDDKIADAILAAGFSLRAK